MVQSYSMLIPMLLILLGGAGLIVLLRGLRGRPMLTPPKCAKCGYDIRTFSGEAPTLCSECGADLTQTYAIRWGDKQRRPRLIWLGAIMLVLPVLLFFSLTMNFSRGVIVGRTMPAN